MKPSNKTFPNGNGTTHFSDEDDEINVDDFDWTRPAPHPAPNLLREGYTTAITAEDTTLIIPTYTPERLKQVRTMLGMTAEQFGIAVGYASSGAKVRISELENGRQAIPQAVSIIAAYMEQYGVLTSSTKKPQSVRSQKRKSV
jgi:antitoxin component HigA of HigAB toxin-antitoxin module